MCQTGGNVMWACWSGNCDGMGVGEMEAAGVRRLCGGRRSGGYRLDGRAGGHGCQQGWPAKLRYSFQVWYVLVARLMFLCECLDVFVCLQGMSLVWIRGWSVRTSESVFGFGLEMRGCLCPHIFLWTDEPGSRSGLVQSQFYSLDRVFVSGFPVFVWAGLTYSPYSRFWMCFRNYDLWSNRNETAQPKKLMNMKVLMNCVQRKSPTFKKKPLLKLRKHFYSPALFSSRMVQRGPRKGGCLK